MRLRKFEEVDIGLSVWIFFAFMFAMETTLRGVNYDDGDRRMLKTISVVIRVDEVDITLT